MVDDVIHLLDVMLSTCFIRKIGYWSPCIGEDARNWTTNWWPSFTLGSHVNNWTYLWIIFDFLWLKGQILCHGGVSRVLWFTDRRYWPLQPLHRWCTASPLHAPAWRIQTAMHRLLTSNPRPWRPWWCRIPSDTPLNLMDTTTQRQHTVPASWVARRSVTQPAGTHPQPAGGDTTVAISSTIELQLRFECSKVD